MRLQITSSDGHHNCDVEPAIAGDLVIQNGHADCVFEVVRTIPDQERLFVVDNTGKYGRGNEFEIFFEEVSKHFREITSKEKV